MRIRLLSVLVACLTAVLVAAGLYTWRTTQATRQVQALEHAPIAATVLKAPAHYVGIVSRNFPDFVASCGCRPNVAASYINVGVPVTPLQPHHALVLGATPLLELLPYKIPLSDIIAGRYDAWFRSYAQMVRGQRAQVLMSFEPEANGTWYRWGWTHVAPATEVAAWRHVVTLFRATGATNALWVWIVNTVYPYSGPLSQLWPGMAYVSQVGIDGYFLHPGLTFASVFAPTVDEVRAITSKPVMISETAANGIAGKARALRMLTAGIAQYKLNGFIWFDINLPENRNHDQQDYAITGDPAAMAIYQADLRPYERPLAGRALPPGC